MRKSNTNEIHKNLHTVPLHMKFTRALTFENAKSAMHRQASTNSSARLPLTHLLLPSFDASSPALSPGVCPSSLPAFPSNPDASPLPPPHHGFVTSVRGFAEAELVAACFNCRRICIIREHILLLKGHILHLQVSFVNSYAKEKASRHMYKHSSVNVKGVLRAQTYASMSIVWMGRSCQYGTSSW